MELLHEKTERRRKQIKESKKDLPFLKDLKRTLLKSRKSLVFFVVFSAFCFAAMVQMSVSMIDLASETMAWMIFTIGMILALTTLFLSLSSVVKGNAKTIAMMKAFGYEERVCKETLLGTYRPFAYLGFLIGTFYQYLLLKMVIVFFFSDVENMPAYAFDWKALGITLFVFVIVYELTMLFYACRIKRLSLKSVMSE